MSSCSRKRTRLSDSLHRLNLTLTYDLVDLCASMLTSAAGIMTPASAPVDSEAEKIAKRERLELEAFIEAWHGIQEQKIYIEEHAGQHQVELDQKMDDLTQLQTITAAIEDLKLARRSHSIEDEETSATSWNTLINKLEAIQRDYSMH